MNIESGRQLLTLILSERRELARRCIASLARMNLGRGWRSRDNIMHALRYLGKGQLPEDAKNLIPHLLGVCFGDPRAEKDYVDWWFCDADENICFSQKPVETDRTLFHFVKFMPTANLLRQIIGSMRGFNPTPEIDDRVGFALKSLNVPRGLNDVALAVFDWARGKSTAPAPAPVKKEKEYHCAFCKKPCNKGGVCETCRKEIEPYIIKRKKVTTNLLDQ